MGIALGADCDAAWGGAHRHGVPSVAAWRLCVRVPRKAGSRARPPGMGGSWASQSGRSLPAAALFPVIGRLGPAGSSAGKRQLNPGEDPQLRLGGQRLPSSPTKVTGAIGSRGRAELHKQGWGWRRCVTGDVRWAWRELGRPHPASGAWPATGLRAGVRAAHGFQVLPKNACRFGSSWWFQPAHFKSYLFQNTYVLAFEYT